ncbi:MAG: hypothetical protein LQ340_003655 [Diploschistes diacapsis]|nr:MAG: hypothetical protein LQ340_003655 [Diploschistes diacapsis]
MSFSQPEGPPVKKRRFFDIEPDLSPAPKSPKLSKATSSTSDNGGREDEGFSNTHNSQLPNGSANGASTGSTNFDQMLFESIVGEVPKNTLKALKDVSGNSTERAINMYLDGSWQISVPSRPSIATSARPQAQNSKNAIAEQPPKKGPPVVLDNMPEHRYIGAFGVGGWATKSGTGLLKHGEPVRIERAKPRQTKTGRGGRPIPLSRQKADIVVRFTNDRGQEIGRLPQDTAAWVSCLIDAHVCHFEGTCVFAPDKVRINDTIYLQLRCSLLRRIFDSEAFIKPIDNNRASGFFEENETSEEQELRLRQVALVKLFDEINLTASSSNDIAQKNRDGILQAAEVAEQHEKQDREKKDRATPNGGSTPSEEEVPEEGKELEQDQLDSLYKKAQSFDFETPEQHPADNFVLELRKYQKQALHWMMSKERDEKTNDAQKSMHPLWEEYRWPEKDVDDKELPRVDGQGCFYVNLYSGELTLEFPTQEQHCLGGVLADEMGLGKTIECLSLIHSNKSEVAQALEQAPPPSTSHLPRLPMRNKIESAPCTTLVVAPMSLLAQWESEAVKASKPGTLRSLMYYGPDKATNLQNICCEANAGSAPNLVITSYGVILSEFTQIAVNGGDRVSQGGLFSLDFFRIILDEAHFIKNRQSKTAKACYELNARHRWVLTGTPIVNRLEDLFSLVRFLRVEPWSNFSFWKTFITTPFESGNFIRALNVVQTVLEPLVIRRTKDMKTPEGEPLVPLPPRSIEVEELQLSKAEQEVYDYIYTRAKRTFNATMEAGNVLKSYTTIFAQILRLRQSCCHPVLTRNKAIATEEEEAAAASDIANGLADDMDLQSLIDRFESEESEQDANKFGAHVLKQIQDEAEHECPLCFEEPMINPAVTGCWHSACKNCLLDFIDHEKDKHRLPLCFNCREPINQRDVFEIIHHDDDLDADVAQQQQKTPIQVRNTYFANGNGTEVDADDLYNSSPVTSPRKRTLVAQTSSPDAASKRISLRRIGANGSAKIAALISHLKRLRRTAPGTKSVVFSQFTSFLDLIGPALAREGITFLRFDGAMSQKARAAVLTDFSADNSLDSKTKGRGKGPKGGASVLLLSLRAGGVGLNLTVAKRVFMMDPWWSFAVEAQAIDRVHRMGQDQEVKVVRFVARESIEKRMLKVQDRKRFM